MYLFIDTTKDITVGLLNKNLSWVEYNHYVDTKSSAKIHYYIYKVCETNKLPIKDISGVFQVAGPGSYTGMRVSDGISQIFSWRGFKTYSFYHFDVPFLLGVQKGKWISNAFKGELFVHEWDGENVWQGLVEPKQFFKTIAPSNIYTSYNNDKLEGNFLLSSDLIKKNSNELFRKVLEQDLRKDLFYYRTIEQEYKRKEV